ncbi:MAG: hypothetical protein K8M05_39035 [Deltaproteobacteria bacterium]|nr:hypothetical protein [Kofleriaceae bacterium]
MRRDVWIGDLIAAWAAVDRRPDVLERIVTLLGLDAFEVEEPFVAEERAPPPAVPMAPLPAPMKTVLAPMPMAMPGFAPAPAGGAPVPRRVRSLVIQSMSPEVLRTPVWSGPRLPTAPSDAMPARLEPLFPHSVARAVLGAAAHSVRNVGPFDMDEAVRVVAQRRPVREIPRDTARTMRAGIQLVIDRTWAMRPFVDDIVVLRRQLLTVVGRDLIDELWFFGDLGACRRPRRVGGRARRQANDAAWQPPDGGIPVIVVTDLGHADRANGDVRAASAWDELFRRARDAGCDVVSIVPRRIGKEDRHARTSAVAWDTRTTVGRVLAERERTRG